MIKVMMADNLYGIESGKLKESDWQLVAERNTYKAALEDIVDLLNNGDLDVPILVNQKIQPTNFPLSEIKLFVAPKVEGTTIDTPELDKATKNDDKIRIITAFVIWLYSVKNITLSKPENLPIQKLVAEYFDIDLKKLDDDKRKLLTFMKDDKDEQNENNKD